MQFPNITIFWSIGEIYFLASSLSSIFQARSSGPPTTCATIIQSMPGPPSSTGSQALKTLICNLFYCRLRANWPNFVNQTNSCSQCDILFQSQDKLAFHIGAKHEEVDAILESKGIPIPKDVETARVNMPGPAPGKVPTPQTASEPENASESPPGIASNSSAPEPGHSSASASASTSASASAATSGKDEGSSCPGVNYDLQCQVGIQLLAEDFWNSWNRILLSFVFYIYSATCQRCVTLLQQPCISWFSIVQTILRAIFR